MNIDTLFIENPSRNSVLFMGFHFEQIYDSHFEVVLNNSFTNDGFLMNCSDYVNFDTEIINKYKYSNSDKWWKYYVFCLTVTTL